jgi:hypothetical protein
MSTFSGMGFPARWAVLAAPIVAACGGFAVPTTPAPAAYRPGAPGAAVPWTTNPYAAGKTLLRFGWQYRDASSSVRGSGSIRITAPDSLRLDFRGPLGQGRGAAVVIARRTVWADPADQVEKFVPNFHLLWGMLGATLGPQAGDEVLAAEDDAVTAWRLVTGADTVDYVRTRVSRAELLTDVRSGGARIGRVVTTIDSTGRPLKARLEVPSGPARLDVTFRSFSNPASHPEGTWDAPVDDQ